MEISESVLTTTIIKQLQNTIILCAAIYYHLCYLLTDNYYFTKLKGQQINYNSSKLTEQQINYNITTLHDKVQRLNKLTFTDTISTTENKLRYSESTT